MNLRNLKALLGSFALFACVLTSTSASAALLLGSATLNKTDDLTVIKAGATTYQFLDLSSTLGWSQADALAEFGDDGFSVATEKDMRRLFDSFGFNFANRKKDAVALDVTRTQALEFTTYLNHPGLALGSFYDSRFGQSWSCISINGCNPENFVGVGDWSNGHPLLGVYLVREAPAKASDVPEPGSLALLGLGVMGLTSVRRRRT